MVFFFFFLHVNRLTRLKKGVRPSPNKLSLNSDIFSGEAAIKDFLLGNPKGFKTPRAMKVGSVTIDLDEGTITGNPIVIHKIEIIAPEITYEKKGNTDNFAAILANITRNAKAAKGEKQKAQKEESGKQGKKLLIKNVIIKNGKVNLAMDLLVVIHLNWKAES